MSGNFLYYMSATDNNSDICDFNIVKYNLLTGEKSNIAKINNLSTWSSVYAFVTADKFFATFGIVENETMYNIHTEVDVKSGEVTVLSKDECFPPLVKNIAVNEDSFIEFQPQKLEDDSYIYFVRAGDAETGYTKDIIVKERKPDRSGEMIVDACVYENVIYTFEFDGQDGYVCSYNLEGDLITKENVEYINEFLNTPDKITGKTETMGDIAVVNGYYFLDTLNGKRLVLQKTSDGWIKKEDLIMNRTGAISNLVKNSNPLGKKVILYDYNKEQLSCLDTEKDKNVNLNWDLTGAKFCMTDGKQLVFLNSENEYCYISDVFAK